MFVLSSPSGAGKSTIAGKLLAAEPGLGVSVSYTTRPMRPGEVDGREYHFIDLETFRTMVEEHKFLEWAHVFGHRYGTPKEDVFHNLGEGTDILFDIDWQGAQQLHQIAGGDVVRVFVLPPSMAELRQRLERRATDPQDVIDARMERAMTADAVWAAAQVDEAWQEEHWGVDPLAVAARDAHRRDCDAGARMLELL